MANQVFECTVSGNLAGQFVQSVFHFHGNITPGYNIFQESINLLTFLSDAWMLAFTNALPSDYNSTSMRCRGVMGVLGPTAIMLPVAYVGGQFAGQRVGNIQSAQVNPLISWIGTAHPSNTGRTFMPGVSEADLDAMAIQPGLLAALAAFITEHKTGNPTGFGWDAQGVIFTRPRPLEVPPVVAAYDLIFDGQVAPLIGTQRRRLHPV